MKQYHNVHDNVCPNCGANVKIVGSLFLGEHVRVDSECFACHHNLMALYHIVSIVDEDADNEQ